MVRGKIRINTRLERVKMATKPKKVDGRNLHLHKPEFQLELKNKFEALDNILARDLDTDADTIANIIHSTAISVAGRQNRTNCQKTQSNYGKKKRIEEEMNHKKKHRIL